MCYRQTYDSIVSKEDKEHITTILRLVQTNWHGCFWFCIFPSIYDVPEAHVRVGELREYQGGLWMYRFACVYAWLMIA
jgi:hypothetical protein